MFMKFKIKGCPEERDARYDKFDEVRNMRYREPFPGCREYEPVLCTAHKGVVFTSRDDGGDSE